MKTILGIETSCDETGAAIAELKNNRVSIKSNIVASSAELQAKYGGIIPEQAAREQMRSIIPVIEECLNQSQTKPEDIDAIAVTYGPGLVGSLLVGVETAKILSLIWKKKVIPVNHLIGHFYANWINDENKSLTDFPEFPFTGLLVSGGHTDLLLFTGHNQYKYLGGTRDDAAGEAFDKSARLLGLPYPGGPQISKLADSGNPKSYNLPRPLVDSDNLDFSFSGLKTAVSNLVSSIEVTDNNLPDICASIQQAIVDTLVLKTIKAAKSTNTYQIVLAGGVAANKRLVAEFNSRFTGQVIVPPPYLCTDNAAMTAAAGFFASELGNSVNLQANPNLSFNY